jgi:hypothetical protein
MANCSPAGSLNYSCSIATPPIIAALVRQLVRLSAGLLPGIAGLAFLNRRQRRMRFGESGVVVPGRRRQPSGSDGAIRRLQEPWGVTHPNTVEELAYCFRSIRRWDHSRLV